MENAFDFPSFVPAYIRPLFCQGIGPFRWVALSGDPEDIYKTDAKVKELIPDNPHLHRWLGTAKERIPIKLAESAKPNINAAEQVVLEVIRQGRTFYGIHTGFGLLANTRIDVSELELLQRSIVLSHAAGTGDFMSENTVRLMLLLKINSLSWGCSGIRLKVIEAIIALYNAEVYPAIPEKGSDGASGDLAPLAHISVVLLAEGEVFQKGQRMSAKQGLAIAGLSQISLAPKEGLALLNGTQASTAFALQGLFGAECALYCGIAIGSLSVVGAEGSRVPFDDRIHQTRDHKGQIDIAGVYRSLLGESEIGSSHVGCEKVQDPYSLRRQPQVMGACLKHIRYVAETLVTEANGVSDNPLLFVDSGDILSGGNLHAEVVAITADMLAVSLCETGALSERRIALLIDPNLSNLPPFLVNNGGVNSGFMIAQVTSAALASENKTYAHPASIDSLPTSANQEDHVSMATFAARRLRDIYDNVSGIFAIE